MPATTRSEPKPQPLEAATLPHALLKLATVEAMTGISRPNIYRRMAKGDFPAAIRMGKRCTRWPASAVREWVEAQQAAVLGGAK
jgi:prophage regulatory protein